MSNPFVMPDPVEKEDALAMPESAAPAADPFIMPSNVEADVDVQINYAEPEKQEHSFIGDVQRGYHNQMAGSDTLNAERNLKRTDIYERMAAGNTKMGDLYKEWKAAGLPKDMFRALSPAQAAQMSEKLRQDASKDIVSSFEHNEKKDSFAQHGDMAGFQKAKGWVDPLKELSPGLVTSMIAESFGGQVPSLPYMIMGAAGRLPLAVGSAVSGYQTEAKASSNDIVNAMAKIDPTFNPKDEEQVTKFLASPEFKATFKQGLPKAAIVGIFEGIGGFLASSGIKSVADVAKQGLYGGVAGATGDAAGDLAIGKPISPQGVYGEFFAEAGMQVPTAAIFGGKAATAKIKDVVQGDSNPDVKGLEAELLRKAEERKYVVTSEAPLSEEAALGPTPSGDFQVPSDLSAEVTEASTSNALIMPDSEPNISDTNNLPPIDTDTIKYAPVEDTVAPVMEQENSATTSPEPVVNTVSDVPNTAKTVLSHLFPDSENQGYGDTPIIIQKLPEGQSLVGSAVEANPDGSYTVTLPSTGKDPRPALIELANKVQADQLKESDTPIKDIPPAQEAAMRQSEKAKQQDQLNAASRIDPTNPFIGPIQRDLDVADGMNDLASLDLPKTDFDSKLDMVIYKLSSVPRSIAEFLPTLIANAPDKGYAAIANRAMQVITAMEQKGMPITIRILGEQAIENSPRYSAIARDGIKGWAASSLDGGYEIVIRSSLNPNNNGARFETILHEIVHVATMGSVYAYERGDTTFSPTQESALLDLMELTAELQKLANAEKAKGDTTALPMSVRRWLFGKSNALDDPNEVLAYGLTNPEVRAWLRNIEYKKTNRSILGKWYSAVLKFFDLQETHEKSALGRLLGIYNDLTNEGMWEYGDPQSNLDQDGQIEVPPLDSAVIDASVHNYGNKWAVHSGMVDGRVTNPYQVDLDKLHKLNAAKKNIAKWFNFSDANALVEYAQDGKTDNIKPSEEPGPFTIIQHPSLEGNGKAVIYHPDNFGMLKELRKNFPNLRIMSQFEAESLLKTGKPTSQAVQEWRESTDAVESIEMMKKVGGSNRKKNFVLEQSLEKLKQFRNNLSLADAVAITLDTKEDLKQNFTDVLTGGVQTKATNTGNSIVLAIRTLINGMIALNNAFERNVLSNMQTGWKNFSYREREAVMQAMLAADKNEVDLTRDVLEKYGYTPAMIEMIESYYKADKYLYEQGNINLAEQGLPLVHRRAGHFPGVFKDDYLAVVYDKKGAPITVLGAKTRGGMRAVQKKFSEGMEPGSFTIGAVRRKGLKNETDFTLAEHFFESVEKVITDADPAMAKKAIDAQRSGTTMGHHFLGFSKHEKAKKGIGGSAGRKSWLSDQENAQEQFEAMVGYLKQGMAHHNTMPVLSELGKLFENHDLVSVAPNTLRYVNMVMSNLTNSQVQTHLQHHGYNTIKALGSALDGLLDTMPRWFGVGRGSITKATATMRETFAQMAMGFFNVAFATMQFLQIPLFAFPMWVHIRGKLPAKLTADKVDVQNALAQTWKVFRMVRTNDGKSIYKSDQWKSMSKEDQLITEYMLDNAMITMDDLEEQNKMAGVYRPSQSRLQKAVNYSRNAPEQLTRPLVFNMMLNTIRKRGIPLKEAMDIAMNATQASMFSYDQMHRPVAFAALGQVGRFMGQLQIFVAGSYSYMSMMGFKPKEHAPMIMAFIATWITLNGLDNLPGTDEAEWMFGFLSKMVMKERLSLKKWTELNLPDAVRFGLIAQITGVNTYSRTRMKSIGEFIEPLTNLSKATQIAPSINYYTNIAGNTFKWYGDPRNPRLGREAFRSMIPSSARYIADAGVDGLFQGLRRNAKGEIVNSRGWTMVHKEDMNDDAIPNIARYLGYLPQSESKFAEDSYKYESRKRTLTEDKAEISDKIRVYLFEGRPTETEYFNKLLDTADRLGVNTMKIMSIQDQERYRREAESDAMTRAEETYKLTGARARRYQKLERQSLGDLFKSEK